jgi:predicted DNA-binding protein
VLDKKQQEMPPLNILVKLRVTRWKYFMKYSKSYKSEENSKSVKKQFRATPAEAELLKRMSEFFGKSESFIVIEALELYAREKGLLDYKSDVRERLLQGCLLKN